MFSYQIYPTLLDAFQRYLDADSATDATQELINKINRVPFTSEAAAKGTAFNDILDAMVIRKADGALYHALTSTNPADTIDWMGKDGVIYTFPLKVIGEVYRRLEQTTPQVFIDGRIHTSEGMVKLYGYIDNLERGSAIDLKTTSTYLLGKYRKGWQHIVYPHCLLQNGVSLDAARHFTYLATDFKDVFSEEYIYQPARDEARLLEHIERLIEFLEANQARITDRKIFGQMPVKAHPNAVQLYQL